MAGRWLPSRNKILKGENITKKVGEYRERYRQARASTCPGREGYGLRADAGAKGHWDGSDELSHEQASSEKKLATGSDGAR
jgi:hypothetical protein